MKKMGVSLFALLLLTIVILAQPASVRAATSYIDMTCEEVAREWDINRGMTACPAPSTTGSIPAGDQQIPSQGGLMRSGVRFMGFTLVGDIMGACTSLCPEAQAAFFSNSALGTTNKLIASMYANPPASGIYYARDVLHNTGLVKSAYAQGIGFSGLTPILPIWKAFRNISYIIIVIILVVIGFMIMFRMKINPQTVISIQSALPNIVMTLILITFSYAIAGLLIDLMYFVMNLVIIIMLGSGFSGWTNTPANVANLQQFYLNANMGDLFVAVFLQQTLVALPAAIFGSGWHVLGDAFTGSFTDFFVTIVPGLIATFVTGALGVIGLLLIALTLLFSFVRIFITLLNCYIQIILAIILAPFQLLVGAVPGKSTFRNWLFGLIGNLAVFPTTVFIFLLAGGFAHATGDQTTNPANMWAPPFIAGPSSSNPGIITGLIGLGLIILAPSLLTAVKDAFGAKPVLPIGPGTIFQPIMGAGQTAAQTFMSFNYLSSGLSGITGFLHPKKKPGSEPLTGGPQR